MEILVTIFSKAIKTAITAGVAAVSSAATATINAQYSRATTMKYTSDIDTYNNQSFSVDTKERKYQWVQVTKIREGGTPISVTVANAEMILDIFKDQGNQYGLYHIINVSTTRTRRVKSQARTLVGIDYHNYDLRNLKNLLKDIQAHTTDHM